MRHVQKDGPASRAGDLRDDPSRDHIPRGELVHEALPVGVLQDRPLPAHALGEEEARRALQEEGRGVKLHELEVRQDHPRAEGHGHAVPGGDGRVGGLLVETAQSARCDEDCAGEDGDGPVVRLVEEPGAPAPRVVQDEPDGHVIGHHVNPFLGRGALREGPFQFLTRGVALGVKDALLAVGRLSREVEFAGLSVEPGPPLDELEDRPGALLHEHPNGGLLQSPSPASSVSCRCCSGVLALGERRGDAALGVLGVRFAQAVLGGDEHAPARAGRLDGAPKARDARAEHEEVAGEG